MRSILIQIRYFIMIKIVFFEYLGHTISFLKVKLYGFFHLKLTRWNLQVARLILLDQKSIHVVAGIVRIFI